MRKKPKKHPSRCETAHPLKPCTCSCGGKYHGLRYKSKTKNLFEM